MATVVTPQRQWLTASGYAFILLMPSLLLAGVLAGLPYLAVGVAFLVLPLMRILFGSYQETDSTVWDEGVATALHRLPITYACMLLVCLVLVAAWLSVNPRLGISGAIGTGLSLWITLLFGLCPAHELVHRRDRRTRLLGAVLSGALGYPALAIEHPIHHARAGNAELAEWPRFDESVWRFSWRRLKQVAGDMLTTLLLPWSTASLSSAQVQVLGALATMAIVAGMFYVVGGETGLMVYLAAAAGCALGMQIITYIQHWALADADWVGKAPQGLAWEDNCRFQAWITLHISFHQKHHQSPSTPFYRLGMDANSPRLPAGYIVMMLICLVPPLWRRVMLPALTEWKVGSAGIPPAPRRLACFGLYQVPQRGNQTSAEA